MTSNQSLFPLLLGLEWQQLPAPIQQMHGQSDRLVAKGIADVESSGNWLARSLRRQLGLPMPGRQQAVEVTIERRETHETWTRRFASGCMRSTLCHAPGASLLIEQLGAITLRFALTGDHDGIDWKLYGARVFGLPVPRFFLGSVIARCSSENKRYMFQIDTRLPLLGQLVAYRGWLEVVDES